MHAMLPSCEANGFMDQHSKNQVWFLSLLEIGAVTYRKKSKSKIIMDKYWKLVTKTTFRWSAMIVVSIGNC